MSEEVILCRHCKQSHEPQFTQVKEDDHYVLRVTQSFCHAAIDEAKQRWFNAYSLALQDWRSSPTEPERSDDAASDAVADSACDQENDYRKYIWSDDDA